MSTDRSPRDASTVTPVSPLPERVQADLREAMRRGDRAAVSTLRTLLAAFANAEAPPLTASGRHRPPTEPVVGRLVEHPRLELSDDDRRAIVADEIADRRDSAAQYRRAGRADAAAELEVEIALLESSL